MTGSQLAGDYLEELHWLAEYNLNEIPHGWLDIVC